MPFWDPRERRSRPGFVGEGGRGYHTLTLIGEDAQCASSTCVRTR